MLVCAPSNAAIDEIVSRLLQHTGPGMLNERGESFLPTVVRVGPNIKETLMEVALDTLAKKRQAEHNDGGGAALTYVSRSSTGAQQHTLPSTADRLPPSHPSDHHILPTSTTFHPLAGTTTRCRSQRGEHRVHHACARATRCSQLRQGFDTVLIDEAAQAVEVSTLIPLKYACRRLILGDPNQLPATVFSEHSLKHNYEQSLFQRLQIGGQRVAMLTTQYRMHPHISRFPGRRFYDGALKDAPSMASITKAPWHAQRLFGPYVFYDVAEGVATLDEATATSWMNELEATLAVRIVQHLLTHYSASAAAAAPAEGEGAGSEAAVKADGSAGDAPPVSLSPSSIGVISPYNAQVKYLRKLLAEALGPEVGHRIEVNSVDGFQGREKEVIILSCVRSDRGNDGGKRGIGFLKDARRMNVSITRARRPSRPRTRADVARGPAVGGDTTRRERTALPRAHARPHRHLVRVGRQRTDGRGAGRGLARARAGRRARRSRWVNR